MILFLMGILILSITAGLVFFISLKKMASVLRLFLATGLVCIIVGTYYHLGAWSGYQHWLAEKEAVEKVRSMPPQTLISLFKKHLATHPTDAKGWYLLGRLYAHEGQWLAAKAAFKEAKKYQA